MGSPIPESWRVRVRAILDSGDLKKSVIVRERARMNWSDLFPNLFVCDLLTALSEALEDSNLIGNQVFDMDEPGQVYEFIFTYATRQIYSKINLCPDGKIIIIYSAHRPLKGNTI
jgi:hypothetical protein